MAAWEDADCGDSTRACRRCVMASSCMLGVSQWRGTENCKNWRGQGGGGKKTKQSTVGYDELKLLKCSSKVEQNGLPHF